jgi:phage terminase large subunit GpA-like protein
LPEEDTLIEMIREADLDQIAKDHSYIYCIHCGERIAQSSKHLMNLKGVWLAENQTIAADGTISGEAPKSPVAGFWMGGVAAAYQSWHSLIIRYLQGLREYALSGSDLSLQNTVNTDQGMPYLPRILAKSGGVSSGPESRKEANMERFIVPDEARFLVASVDVQGGQTGRFVVQVHAVGKHMEQWLIDRYAITTSSRQGIDGDPAPIDPASYPEDWDMLTSMVVDSTYRLIDGREMRIRMVGVDTGGEDGVTDKAYGWYRRLRREGKHGRVMLIKGASAKGAPLIKESLVGAKKTGEKGDIPLYLLNPNVLKDAVAASLRRANVGPGYMHYGTWTPKAFFDELSAEIRDANGTWRKVRKRNESLDLSCYIRAGIIKLGADRINWENPPAWADDLAINVDVITREDRQKIQADVPDIGVARRRSSRSSYLS